MYMIQSSLSSIQAIMQILLSHIQSGLTMEVEYEDSRPETWILHKVSASMVVCMQQAYVNDLFTDLFRKNHPHL